MSMSEFSVNAKSFYLKCRRVWQVLRKPTKEEFKAVSKISAITILLLGIAGFIISLVVSSLF